MIKITNINQINEFNEQGEALLYINSIELYKSFYEQVISEKIVNIVNKESWHGDYRLGVKYIHEEYTRRMDKNSHMIVLKVKKIDQKIKFVFALITNNSFPKYCMYKNSYAVDIIWGIYNGF